MAETMGSIINNHTGKGCYLESVNFNKEVYLEFNLGLLFKVESVVKGVYELKKKEYIYKRNVSGLRTIS